MPLARPHSLPIYCIRLYTFRTYPYATGIASAAASPFGECIFGRCFLDVTEVSAGKAYFWRTKSSETIKTKCYALNYKCRVTFAVTTPSPPPPTAPFYNYYTTCNFNRVCPPLCLPTYHLLTYQLSYIWWSSDHGRRQ